MQGYERVRLQLSECNVLGVVGLGPPQLLGEVPGPTPEHGVAEEADRHGPDAGEPVESDIWRDLAAVHGLVHGRQRLRAQERRRKKLVLGPDLDPLIRQVENDAAVDDESGHLPSTLPKEVRPLDVVGHSAQSHASLVPMRATVMYGAGDVRVETVPDARLVEPTDALVTVTRSAICGSDLWPYKQMERSETGRRMGHEFIGVVEAVGDEVRTVKPGDVVVTPFVWSDGTCVFCREGLHTSCLHGGRYGFDGVDGGQGEAVRVPQADGTLVVLPVERDDALMPSLLTLSDVMATGHHAARSAEVGPGKTVAVVGDGAVGLCGVIASRRLGAERIIVLGRHPDRIALAKQFGATDVVSERGDEAVERVRELTDGFGAHSALECVGLEQSTVTALTIVRPGGAVGRVGVPQEESIPDAQPTFFDNVTIAGGPAPARAYIEELLPDVLEGRIEPGRVFDRVGPLDEVPDGYRAMDDREAIKVMIEL